MSDDDYTHIGNIKSLTAERDALKVDNHTLKLKLEDIQATWGAVCEDLEAKLAIATIAPVGSYIEPIETITIGNYRISKYSGGYWISTDGGEGMQTNEDLEKCIAEFYKREL